MGDMTHVGVNTEGQARVQKIEWEFNDIMNQMLNICPSGRELALVRTKLQEACFWAKKAVCESSQFQQNDPVIP